MSQNILELSDSTFDQEVKKAAGAVLVDFWAPWCGPCQMVGPMVEKIAVELGEKIKVCKVNIDDNQKTASELGIMSIPTLVVFKDGAEKERIVGALGESELKEKIGQHVE
ncbi:MAG: thioredoxin [Candidatus Omnitrophica bacterium]|nr:thioredoxin [Candidatus Omnitrophota bacterium]